MIDGLYSALEQYPASPQATAQPQKILRMVKSERMGGSIPVWETPKNNVESSLNQAANAESQATPESAMAYKAQSAGTYGAQTDEFGFADLIDMVNPLHHIPVVGQIYRELSGDEIKPIGNIIGGAIYGGALGAAGGLINAVIQEETGKDLTGNAMALVLNGESPHFRTRGAPALSETPEMRLAAVEINTQGPSSPAPAQQDDIPGNLLAFVDMKARPQIVIERSPAADGRTAGSFDKKSYPALNESAQTLREPITQVRFNTYRTND